MSYPSKNELVQARQLKTRRLVLPFLVNGEATATSKTVTIDDPSLLFLQFEGAPLGLTAALGALSAAEVSATTFASSSDANGIFSAVIYVGEAINKVLMIRLCKVGAVEANVCGTTPTGVTRFISAGGERIEVNFDCTTNFATDANSEWVIEVEYQVSE